MLTTHNAPYLGQSVTTTEPHGRLVMPLSPPPGRPWPSFLKNAQESNGLPCLVHTSRSEGILPTPLHAEQRGNLLMELLQEVSVRNETGDGAFNSSTALCRL